MCQYTFILDFAKAFSSQESDCHFFIDGASYEAESYINIVLFFLFVEY